MNPSEAPPGTIAVLETTGIGTCNLCIFGKVVKSFCEEKHKCTETLRTDRCNVYYIQAPKHYVRKEES